MQWPSTLCLLPRGVAALTFTLLLSGLGCAMGESQVSSDSDGPRAWVDAGQARDAGDLDPGDAASSHEGQAIADSDHRADGPGFDTGTPDQGTHSDAAVDIRVPDACVAQCADKECGSDSCGGSCAICAQGNECNADGLCIPSNGTALLNLSPSASSPSAHQGTYLRATRLASGTIVGGFDGPAGNDRTIRVVRSTNNGVAWSDVGTVATHSGNIDLANAFPIELAGGRILMAFRHHDYFVNPFIYRIEISYSDDGGNSWLFLSSPENGLVPIWEPFLLRAPDGSLQVYYARERGTNEQDVVMRRSWDGGLSWGALVTVASAAGSRDGMPAVTELEDGSLLAVFEGFRAGRPGRFVVQSVRSTDRGSSWSGRQIVYAPQASGRQAGAPYVVTLGNGQLMVSFMTDEDTATPAWPSQASMKVILSTSAPTIGTPSWQPSATSIVGPSTYWPAVLPVANKEVLFLYSKSGVRVRRGTLLWK